MSFISWCDSYWAVDVDNRWSITNCLFQHANGLISWQYKKQSIVAISTTKVEYMAITSATKEALWIYQSVFDLGFHIPHPI
jgi:hypothetical protein